MAINNLWDTYGGLAPVSVYALKKRISTYAGPLVRIRDSANAVEQDVGFAANGNLATFVTVGDPFVTIWYDQMGNDNLTNPNTASQPQLLPTGSNIGNPIVDFSTGDKWLKGTDFISPSAHPHDIARPTWFGSYERVDSNHTNQMVMAIGDNPASIFNKILYGVGRNLNGRAYSNPNNIATYWGSNAVPFDTVNFLLDMQEVITDLRMYENSSVLPTSHAAGNITATNTTSVSMGKFSTNNSLRGYNRITELVIQNAAVSNTDRTNIFDTLSNNYSNKSAPGNYKTSTTMSVGNSSLTTPKTSTTMSVGNSSLTTPKTSTSYTSAAQVGLIKFSAVATLETLNLTFTITTTVT